MNRIFLALMALFVGLIEPAGPVEARIRLASDTEIGLVTGQRLGARTAAPQQTAAEQVGTSRSDRRDRAAPRTRSPRAKVFIPPVLFQVDRALE